MSLPKCFNLLNIGYFDNITVQVQACQTIEELQALVDGVFADISMLESTLTSQITLLEPINALISMSITDLPSVISFITNLINDVIKPIVGPYVTAVAQIALLTEQVTTLIASIEQFKELKFPTLTINIPSITIGCSL